MPDPQGRQQISPLCAAEPSQHQSASDTPNGGSRAMITRPTTTFREILAD
jgi:hypothetical protein